MPADAGCDTSVKPLANREPHEPALEKGRIDVVPEYAATLADFLNTEVNGADSEPVDSSDVTATVAALTAPTGPRGLKVLRAGQAVDRNSFAVDKDCAEHHHRKALFDLGAAKLKIKLAGGDECPDRPFCAPGLKKTSASTARQSTPRASPPSSPSRPSRTAPTGWSSPRTEAALDPFGPVLLAGGKHQQNAGAVPPVAKTKDAGEPGVATTLDKLTRVLATADLTELGKKAGAERQKPADVVAEYPDSKGL